MRDTGVESLHLPLGWMNLHDSSNDVAIGHQDKTWCPTNCTHNKKVHYLAEEGTRAREDKQRWQVTEKVVNDSWPTEMQLEYGAHLDQSSEQPSSVFYNDQPQADGGWHEGCVEKRVGDGSIPVICHGHQETAFSAPHANEEEKLSSTAHKGDCLLLLEEVAEHLGGNGGCIWDVNKGQVSKEKIHGRMEAWLHPDQDNEARVPSQSHGVDPQKQHKEDNL